MPTRITHFLHPSEVNGSEAVTTGFTTTARHNHDLQQHLVAFQKNKRNFRGVIEGIHIFLSAAAGGAPPTKVTLRVCADQNGDQVLIPDTEANLVNGITTATLHTAAYSVKLPIFQLNDLATGPGNGFLYLFIKVDDQTQSPVFNKSVITWME